MLNRKGASTFMKILILMKRPDFLQFTGVRVLMTVDMKKMRILYWIHVIMKPLEILLVLLIRDLLI